MNPSPGDSDGLLRRAGVGLGSNVGDRCAHIEEAIRRLRALHAGGDFLVSRCRETAPVDCEPGTAPFLNAVVEMGWAGSARALLATLLATEVAMGRPARHPHHAPRTIDLDLLYLGDLVVEEPDLILPHPRIARRAFVLHPLRDIRPDLLLPGQSQTVGDLAQNLPERLTAVDSPEPLANLRGMSTVFEFLDGFRALLHGAGIRFAITSGMACVRYGLQQTTKDSDWIIGPEHLARLRSVLDAMESAFPPAVVVYRPIFGAPLDERWHRGGWTSHVAVRVKPDGLAHHLDFFGCPPRVHTWRQDPDQPDFADRDTVARMKKTDRDRDWPILDALAAQATLGNRQEALLHLQSAKLLRAAWRHAPESSREAAAALRPLLRLLDREPDDLRMEANIRAERLIWENVNRGRYRLYQHRWKTFYRRWQSEPDWHWPTVEPFAAQHLRLIAAAERHGLSADPLSEPGVRQQIYQEGIARAAILAHLAVEEIERLAPPLEEILP